MLYLIIHPSDIDFRDAMNLYKNVLQNQIFLTIDATLALDNHLRFRKNLLERIWKPIMIIQNKIRHENLQYDNNREVAKISALLSWKIGKYEFLTGEEILHSNRRQIIEQAKFTYSLFRKALEKQTEQQFDALKSLNVFNKTDELKQIDSTFTRNFLNDLIV